MKCPFCGHLDDKVIDSRTARDGDVIRRRRECQKCEMRFTSYERVENVMPLIVKKDGSREPFDRIKVLTGLNKALQKRPVSAEQRERVAEEIEMGLLGTGSKEVSSKEVGEKVMDALRELDKVAYVRFASVYREFKDINEFVDELKTLLNNPKP